MITGTVVLILIWIALTRTVTPAVLAAGVVSACLVMGFWRALMPPSPPLLGHLVRHPLRLAQFVGVLGVRFVLSTLRTAWLILRGREEGRMMALPVRVKNPFGRFMLLNAITLTPSTISLLVEDDLVYIHWLQRKGGRGDWRDIKEDLDTRLCRLFVEDDRGTS